MVWGGTCKTAGMKFYLGIRYSVRMNLKGGGLHINLIPFYFNHEDELPPHAASSTHGAALLCRSYGLTAVALVVLHVCGNGSVVVFIIVIVVSVIIVVVVVVVVTHPRHLLLRRRHHYVT